jgi:glycosyltransferase involved in cell wall biosynthesis
VVEAVAQAARTRPWLHVPSIFPPEVMDSVFADADVVLNTSRFEGMSNALLEAQAAGRPVLADGDPGESPWTRSVAARAAFTDDAAAVRTLAEWLADDDARETLGRDAHRFVRSRFGLDAESAALREAWRAAAR